MIDYTGGSPMGQPGQGNPYNTGMAGPRPSPGFGMGGPGYQAPTLSPNIPMPPPSGDGMDWQAMPGGGYYSNKTPQMPPGGFKPDNMGNSGNSDDLIKLLTQMGIAPDLINKLVQPPDPNLMHTMGQGQAGRSNLSQFAMRAPNQGGMGTGQSPLNRMGNMGGGFGMGQLNTTGMTGQRTPLPSGPTPGQPGYDWNTNPWNVSEGPGGLSGRNQQPGGLQFQRGPVASTSMGMQQRGATGGWNSIPGGSFNPRAMPSMMQSIMPSLPPPANYDPSKPTSPALPVSGMAGNQNTGITGGMNKSYQPQMRSGNTGGGGSFGMGG